MLSERSSPAVVSAAAARKLPRWALIALLVVFIFPHMFSTQLWSGAETSSFGIAWTMASGNLSDFLFPNIAGTPISDVGPLTAWIGAFGIMTIGRFINPVIAFHLTAGLLFAVITASIWYATYYLSRRDEAQPLSFAFGGDVARKDYGRLVADLAVLLTISTYGLLQPLHEPAASTTLLALSALSFFGIVLSLQDVWRGSLIAGIAVGLATVTTTLGAGVWFTFATWVAIFCTPDYTSRSKRALTTLSVAAATALIWPLFAFICYPGEAAVWFKSWLGASVKAFSPLPVTSYPWLLKNLAWITFPAWPLAIWGIFAWRGSLKAAPISVPLSFLAIALFSILFTGLEPRSTFFCLVPSLVVLAAFGLVSLRKSKENLFDLFSSIVYTIGLIVVWLYYFAWSTGLLVKMAHSIQRLAPSVPPGTNVFALILALLITGLWLCMVFWRLFRHPFFAWRGAWLSACGLTATMLVVVCLFSPIIDGARSLDRIAVTLGHALNREVPAYDCVEAPFVGQSDRAAFYYLGGIKFAKPGEKCDYYLLEVPVYDNQKIMDATVEWSPIERTIGKPRSYTEYILFKRNNGK